MPADPETALRAALERLPFDERQAWIGEAQRLASIINSLDAIRPKRRRNPLTGRYEFLPEVVALCQQARSADPAIVRREPHRARPPSPHTLYGWLQVYKREGVSAFLRCINSVASPGSDGRRAAISPAAAEWVNDNWRRFSGPRPLYRALQKEAQLREWLVPSESWLYRRWAKIPEIIKVQKQDGPQAYESRYAPYVPRDFSDLEALQVLCGDHSERDVTVLLRDGSLRRPWLTLWYDLRTGLIWGWHLDLAPSSVTAGLAYADGVENFGAQPLPRPEEGFMSYIYTDRGRDYLSHHWDGRAVQLHKQAMRLEGGLELLRVQRRVGLLDELSVRHLLARGRNAKEKPVERVHKVISQWEQNTFAEYCGSAPGLRPDRWNQLYARQESEKKRGSYAARA